VSCTKIIPDLNLAEGKISAPGSEPKTQTFSSASLICFTDKRNHFIDGDVEGTPHGPSFKNIFLTIQAAKIAEFLALFLLFADPRGIGFAFHRAGTPEKQNDSTLRVIK
jgi:hypothetical protein